MDHTPGCPYCGPVAGTVMRDINTGEDACTRCGTVLGAAGPSRDASDHSTPTPDGVLGGYMGGSAGASKDADGHAVSDRDGVMRQRMWQFRTISRAGGPESIRRGDDMVQTLSDKLSLPACVRLDAIGICDRACRLGMAKGRGAAAVAAAAVLLAVRRADMPRRAGEIAAASNVKHIERHYTAVCRRLETGPLPPKPDLYVAKTSSELGLPDTVTRRASELLVRAREGGGTAGRNPVVLAAGAVHAAALLTGHTVRLADVARAGGASIPAVLRCSGELRGGGVNPIGRAVRRAGVRG